MQGTKSKNEAIWVVATLAFSLGAYAMIFGHFLPLGGDRLGHDYGLHFPNLLAGHFWSLENGILSLPWFTPAQCGGLPFFADLNVGVYSFPQLLSSWFSPLSAVQITFYIFAALGFLGFYIFLRASLKLSMATSLIGASLYFWNGFYAYRMVIGHLVDHGVMLFPWILYFLNRPISSGRGAWPYIKASVAPGLLWAYIFHSGGTAHILLPGFVALLAVALLLRMRDALSQSFISLLALSGAWALALSAAKINGALAFLSHFPRDFYELTGIAKFSHLIWLVAEGVLWSPSLETLSKSLTNNHFTLDMHELEYGLSPLPLLIALAYLFFVGTKSLKHYLWRKELWLLCVLSLVPIVLNFHTAWLHDGLKSVWLLGSQVNLLRWFLFYTIVGVPVTIFLFEGLPEGRFKSSWAVACIVLFLASFNLLRDKAYYEEASGTAFYRPAAIEKSYAQAQETGVVPVKAIAAFLDTNKEPVLTIDRNDVMTQGYSQMVCYQPLFGYRHEKFPRGILQPGPIYLIKDGYLNFKNPACYLFPDENACSPGDHFRSDQLADLELFASYKPFDFELSHRQKGANLINILALVAAMIVVLLGLFKALNSIMSKDADY